MSGPRHSFTLFVGLSVAFHAGLFLWGVLKLPGFEPKTERLQRVTLIQESIGHEFEQAMSQSSSVEQAPSADPVVSHPEKVKAKKIKRVRGVHKKPRRKRAAKISVPRSPKSVERPAEIEPEAQPVAAVVPPAPLSNAAPAASAASSPIGGSAPRTNILPEGKAVCLDDGGLRKKASRNWQKAYKRKVYSRIQRAKRYPYAARRDGLEGRVVVKFTINRSGRVGSIKVVKGSPYSILNSDAIAWIKRAAPFPSFPSDADEFSLSLTYGLRYDLRK